MSDDSEILLNVMYAGSYLEDDNIGHEAINLFKDDNGNNYIYVLPYGTVGQQHNGKVKAVLLIRRHNAQLLEILAKAEGLRSIDGDKNKGTDKDRRKQHLKLIEKIKYNNIPVNKIFDNNKGKDEQNAYVSFSAEEVTKVKKPIYLTIKNVKNKGEAEYQVLPKISTLRFRQTRYISQEENKEAYETLKKIIDTERYWGEPTKKLVDYHDNKNNDLGRHNIIDIIKKGHDELCYSNLLAYFFRAKPSVFQKFAKEFFGIDNLSKNYRVLREWNNIDILIDDYKNSNVVVIENKIKSDINGVIIDDNMQADKNKTNTKSGKEQSQLADYYNLIVHGDKNYDDEKADDVKKGNGNKEDGKYMKYKKKFSVFYPNYSSINLEKYKHGKKYKPIKYSEVFNFFNKHKDEFKEVAYFEEFLYALQKHTRPVDNSNEEEMFKRFMEQTKSKKN